MDYSHIFGSQFPDQVISVGSRKDIDNSVTELVKEYYSYLDAGNNDTANELYNNNKETLEPYTFNSSYFNMLEEEIYNLGVGLLNQTSTLISDSQPITQSVNSYWLEDY